MSRKAVAAVRVSALALAGLLPGCASMPKVTVGYYLPKTSVALTLTQTATCTHDGVPILKSDLVAVANYSSDFYQKRTVKLANLGGRMTKANASFEFYDDGRLKGINTTQTGQGGEVIKALVSLGTSVMGGLLSTDAQPAAQVLELQRANMKLQRALACEKLMKIVGASDKAKTVGSDVAKAKDEEKAAAKSLTIVSRAELPIPDASKVKTVQELTELGAAEHAAWVETENKSALEQKVQELKEELGKKNVTFRFKQISLPDELFQSVRPIFGDIAGLADFNQVAATHESNDSSDETIKVVEPAKAVIRVTVDFIQQFKHAGVEHSETFTAGANISQLGIVYPLPIQKAPHFGENKLELALSESGRVTKLIYTGSGDAAGMLGAITAFTDTQKDPAAVGTADQAKAVQAEADLIYQQQRLVLCQADPATCTK